MVRWLKEGIHFWLWGLPRQTVGSAPAPRAAEHCPRSWHPRGLQYLGQLMRGRSHRASADLHLGVFIQERLWDPRSRQQKSRGLLVIKCIYAGPIPRNRSLEYSILQMHTEGSPRYEKQVQLIRIHFSKRQWLHPLSLPLNTAAKSTECPAKCTCAFRALSCPWEDPVPAWWLAALAHQLSGFTGENNLPLEL